jgi:hypothetical protein
LTSSAALAQQVTWTNLTHADVAGAVLQKTSGCDGCDDAGAASLETIDAGDGYVEFTIEDAGAFLIAGLSHGDDTTSYGDIDFAFRFNGAGWADVLENGVYQSGGDTPYQPGDVFRIAIVGNKVQYIRNGIVLIEREKAVPYPLLLDVTLGTMGASIHDALVGSARRPTAKAGSSRKRDRTPIGRG